ncbi:acyl-CoA dehydrogenase [Caulobacter sp. SLTY]|uniref:acyl-CoA dehydrogenase family protein n=1 Tax=Caulobacter sp. SLTY TaxID=2683262 RepID=UPI001411EE91|nr:acyl-CoA dehydrogenase family protein [Caulobacter sp. SLTY]NBB17518.1 acyl-CoA dehydrogenase [Caulobacter sp. SLTY]
MAVLTEEQTMIRDAAKGWAQEASPTTKLRALRDGGSKAPFDAGVWGEMAEMGWAGVLIDEAHGGSGFGYLSLGLILEETGRTLTASPLLSTALVGASAISMFGSEAQKAEWLPKIAAGEVVTALAVDEGPHHAPEKIALAASGGKLTGKKTFVVDGDAAGLFIVAARTGGKPGETDGISLYLVPADAAGVSVKHLALADSRGAAEVSFDGAAGELLGEEGKGWGPLEAILDRARIGLSAEMLGQSLQAFEITLDYLKTRTQFGQVIGTFQALQHRAAKMFTDLEMARSCIEAALEGLDAGGEDHRAAASLAKCKASELVHLVSNEMVQMHGGIGMTDVHDAGLYLKRARVAEQLFGGAGYHKDRYAKVLGF